MQILNFTLFEEFRNSGFFEPYQTFLQSHPNGNFYQSSDFFQLAESFSEFKPFQLIALDENNNLEGSLLGIFQSNGKGITSWLSRRIIVWGGPLVIDTPCSNKIADQLLSRLKEYAAGRAIFIEFRNLFDVSEMHQSFINEDFEFQSYLNFLIKTDNEAAVLKRMDGNRRRQIRKSLEAGAVITEAKLEEEVKDFYIILEQLYKEKVKKPLPSYELFLKFWQSRIGKFFIVKFDGVVVGGSMCPTFENKIIYDWFRCGKIDVAPGVHAGILAAWASIDYALKHGFEYMDFMGAGRPDEEYGVRTFKEPFGGEKVTFGRYHTIINRPLYQAGKLGLAIYQKIKQ